MSDSIMAHPQRDLVAEANREREIVYSREGHALQEAIEEAVNAYSQFLEDHGLIWEYGPDDPWPRLKVEGLALVVTFDYDKSDGIEICLKNGALDRVYGNGVNPDP
jgi:hypothetical protein